VYLFERDLLLPTSFLERPRQCVPSAVIMYNRVGSLSDVVDLRLMADDHPRRSTTTTTRSVPPDHGTYADMSVVVGQAGRRRVVVSGPDACLVDAALQHSSRRTVQSCASGTITKITINNDREKSEDAHLAVNHRPVTSLDVSSAGSRTSLASPDDINTTVLLPSSGMATKDATETRVGGQRSQYSHQIRRRKRTQTASAAEGISPEKRTQPVQRAAVDQSLPPPPKPGDTPMTLLQRQQVLASIITKQLSVELSAVTSFFRLTKPAHVDDRERVAVESMRSVNAAFQRLTPVCLAYRRFCRLNTCSTTLLPDFDTLRTHDSTLCRCREQLTTSFGERRDVILQTPIAGEQRLFTFVWLQRHSAAIIDCINVVVDVLKAIIPSPTAASTSLTHSPDRRDSAVNADEVKPSISRLEVIRGDSDDARPPLLTPALKTDVVSADELPVLQPSNYPRVDEAATNSTSPLHPPSPATLHRHSSNDRRCSNTSVNLSSSDCLTPAACSVAVKQEQPEKISDAVDPVAVGASKMLDGSKVDDDGVIFTGQQHSFLTP